MIKTFSIDMNNIHEIKNLIKELNIRKDELHKINHKLITKEDPRPQKLLELESYFKIYNSNVSNFFTDYQFSEEPKFYVYAHLNRDLRIQPKRRAKEAFAQMEFKLEFRPFYIGKGTGNRFLRKERNKIYSRYVSNIKNGVEYKY
jgi:hypothetical protein